MATEKVDGRKRRWQEHKIARRVQLVDGTISAVRKHGPNIGMEEIAADIGFSKTVMYRYFVDKADLVSATMERYVQTVLAPRVYAAVAGNHSEYEMTRGAIAAYVETVDSEPELYGYIMNGRGGGVGNSAVAESERMIADMVVLVLNDRLREMGLPTVGAQPWAYAAVGAVQLATDWWIANKQVPVDVLLNALTMQIWTSIDGIVRAGADPTAFAAAPHELPSPPKPNA